MICSKCNTDKPADQYHTYWHIRKEKYYTRRICNDCFKKQQKEHRMKLKELKTILIQVPTSTGIIQPDEPESITIDFSTNNDYKFCIGCEEYKLLSEYYQDKKTGKVFKKCKNCHNKAARKAQDAYWEEKRNTVGIETVDPRPGVFLCPVQKEQTHWLLNLIGWKLVDNKWVKDGIKEWKDGKIVWNNVPETKKKKRKGPTPKAELDMDVVNKMRDQGISFTVIANKFGVTNSTIIKYYYQQNEED